MDAGSGEGRLPSDFSPLRTVCPRLRSDAAIGCASHESRNRRKVRGACPTQWLRPLRERLDLKLPCNRPAPSRGTAVAAALAAAAALVPALSPAAEACTARSAATVPPIVELYTSEGCNS